MCDNEIHNVWLTRAAHAVAYAQFKTTGVVLNCDRKSRYVQIAIRRLSSKGGEFHSNTDVNSHCNTCTCILVIT